jgi:hypothetical protein
MNFESTNTTVDSIESPAEFGVYLLNFKLLNYAK